MSGFAYAGCSLLWLLREVGGQFGTHWAEITMAWAFGWSKERKGEATSERMASRLAFVLFPWYSCCSGGRPVPTVSASARNWRHSSAPASSGHPSSLASSGSVAGLHVKWRRRALWLTGISFHGSLLAPWVRREGSNSWRW
ncbi:hypothetical protein BDZ97DRAFT_1866407 [Flammula alnicola]|nr:hypothetical protein BDZ97DRAFT_1866407 [Flammula alnicola]